MTIDERLEYLLTVQKSHDDQIVALIEQNAAAAVRMSKTEKLMDVLTQRTIQAMDTINRLGHIAANHDERLDNLEGHNPTQV